MATGPRAVVIVGGGFAGAALAVHLLRRASGLSVTLIERGDSIGRGVAYDAKDPIFVLNVPASKMSLDRDRPDDFVEWAGAAATPHAFLPRALYGRYVEARLGEAAQRSACAFRVIRGDAVRALPGAVVLADGARVAADVTILATGPGRTAPLPLPEDPRVIDGWDEHALPGLLSSRRILIVGTGLTALDVLAWLDARSFGGRIVMVSPRGLLPRPHLASPAAPREILLPDAPRGLSSLLQWGRRVVRQVRQEGGAWQQVVDAIRPRVSELWRSLSPTDRARFVRRVRPFWDVLRHRAPVEVLGLVERWRSEGGLELRRGTVVGGHATPGGIAVDLREEGGALRGETFDAVVRAVGPSIEHALGDPLLADLVRSGRALPAPAGLGIVTTPEGRVLGGEGPLPDLFALGAPRRASSWETTSAPEIARDAMALARELTS